jgi:hypothetical protein
LYLAAIIEWSVIMPLPILAVSVALHLVVAASSGVPNFDVLPSCHAATAAQVVNSDKMQACAASEQDAHDHLIKEWTTFQIADRSRCIGMIMDFDPSYTELLTCLDIANDVRKLPKELY